ncbi:MAG: hypothetical protein GTN36_00630 [Candidatus Aenigmarchaeota archaeon]|nr:hypothetical protein [Candidatus Aenigmarchaeota archaeon]
MGDEKSVSEKFVCMNCGCYFYVESRNDFDCPNCVMSNMVRNIELLSEIYGESND